MSKLTITEALQEIKTITSRIEKKRQEIAKYVVRDSRIIDPFAKDGGTEKFIHNERQSISDLEKRIIRLRIGIQRVNQNQDLTLVNTTMTIAEWLIWRREIVNKLMGWQRATIQGIQEIRKNLQTKGGNITSSKNVGNVLIDSSAPIDGLVFLDEYQLHDEMDKTAEMFGALDGKLSMFNATTYFEVAD